MNTSASVLPSQTWSSSADHIPASEEHFHTTALAAAIAAAASAPRGPAASAAEPLHTTVRRQPSLQRLPLSTACRDKLLGVLLDPTQHLDAVTTIVLNNPTLAFDILLQTGKPFEPESCLSEQTHKRLAEIGTDLLSAYALHLPSPLAQHEQAIDALAQHSRHVANLACLLAEHTHICDPDHAYLAGLWHNLGQLRMLQLHGQRYPGLVCDIRESALAAGERKKYGIDHARLGAQLVQSLMQSGPGIPLLYEAIEVHHAPIAFVREMPALPRILRAAVELASHSERAISAAAELLGASIDQIMVWQHQLPASSRPIGEEHTSAAIPLRALEASLAGFIRSAFADMTQDNHLTRLHAGCALLCLRTAPFMFGLADNGSLTPSDGHAAWLLQTEHAFLPHADSICSLALRDEIPYTAHAGDKLAACDWLLIRQLEAHGVECIPWRVSNERGIALFPLNTMAPQATHDSRNLLPLLIQQALAAQERSRAFKLAVSHSETAAREAYRASIRRLAHEISNPLSVICNYLHIIEHREDVDTTLRTQLSLMQSEMERTKRLLGSLSNPKQEKVHTEAPEANRIVQEFRMLYGESLFAVRGIEFDVHLANNLPSIQMPADTLKQVLLNLLLNAAEAVPEGGCVSLSTSSTTNLDGIACVEIRIDDDGPGITHGAMQKNAPTTKTKHNHAGLGLSICYELLNRHGAHLLWRARPAAGTSFHIFIPALLEKHNIHSE